MYVCPMINIFYLSLFLFIIFSIIITIKLDNLSKFISLYDFPDKKRKLHKKKTPIIGWIFCLFCMFFLLAISFFDKNNMIFNKEIFSIYDQINIRSYLSFFLGGLAIFLIGLFDDKKNISANNKMIVLIIILYLLISFDSNLMLNELYFVTFDKLIALENFSMPFTILCVIFLINSLNLFDGINLQSAVFLTFVYSVLIIKGIFNEILVFFLIANLFFALKNYNGKIFYGDSGIYINSYVISYFMLKGYNYRDTLTPDLIFIILFLPSLDMTRLFFARIFKLKNPFEGDRTHIHHIISVFFKGHTYKANYMLFLMIILPFIMYDLFNFDFYISIFTTAFIYFLFVMNFYKYKKNKQK